MKPSAARRFATAQYGMAAAARHNRFHMILLRATRCVPRIGHRALRLEPRFPRATAAVRYACARVRCRARSRA
ncbi:hypothetical protein H371_012975, partial [Burkholderia pseudomallei CB]|nr:hypothetical protein [Burkholderia pseudomallei CB]